MKTFLTIMCACIGFTLAYWNNNPHGNWFFMQVLLLWAVFDGIATIVRVIIWSNKKKHQKPKGEFIRRPRPLMDYDRFNKN